MEKNTERVTDRIDELKFNLGDLGENLKDRMESAVKAGRRRSFAVRDRVVNTGRRAFTGTQGSIKDHPMTSVLITLAVGLAVGFIVDRTLLRG